MNFGKTLKEARLSAGLTQEALAKKCGMKKQNISRYENSEREPNIRTAKAIADALGLPLTALMSSPKDIKLDLQFFKENPQEEPEEHKMILKLFDEMSPELRKIFLAQAEAAIKAQKDRDSR